MPSWEEPKGTPLWALDHRLLLTCARVRDIKPVPVARPTRELGVGVPTVAVPCKIRAFYSSLEVWRFPDTFFLHCWI
jgi:hypothetical protein